MHPRILAHLYRPFQLLLLALIAIPLLARAGSAQEGPSPGARVRITAERWSWERTEARLVARLGDTLVLERQGAPEIRLPIPKVERLEVSTRPRRSGAYAVRGALVGAALGFLAARLVLDARYQDDRYNTAAALLVGAPSGALLGAGVGHALGEERWETVPLR